MLREREHVFAEKDVRNSGYEKTTEGFSAYRFFIVSWRFAASLKRQLQIDVSDSNLTTKSIDLQIVQEIHLYEFSEDFDRRVRPKETRCGFARCLMQEVAQAVDGPNGLSFQVRSLHVHTNSSCCVLRHFMPSSDAQFLRSSPSAAQHNIRTQSRSNQYSSQISKHTVLAPESAYDESSRTF
jgi:hypothetical protein